MDLVIENKNDESGVIIKTKKSNSGDMLAVINTSAPLFYALRISNSGIFSTVSGAIVSNSIADSAITSAKLASQSVTAQKISPGGTEYSVLTTQSGSSSWNLLVKENCSFTNQNLLTTSDVSFRNLAIQSNNQIIYFDLDSQSNHSIVTAYQRLTNPGDYMYDVFDGVRRIWYLVRAGATFKIYELIASDGISKFIINPDLHGGANNPAFVVKDGLNNFNILNITSNGKMFHMFKGNSITNVHEYVFQVKNIDNQINDEFVNDTGVFNITKEGLLEIVVKKQTTNGAIQVNTFDNNAKTGYQPLLLKANGSFYLVNQGATASEVVFGVTSGIGNFTTNITHRQFQIASSGESQFSYKDSLISSGSSPVFQVFEYDTLSTKFLIQADGTVYLQGNVVVTSDKRLKQNIEDYQTKHLSDILNTNIYTFEYTKNPNKKQLGVIAQEIEEKFPFACGRTIHVENFNCDDKNCSCKEEFYNAADHVHEKDKPCWCQTRYRTVDYSRLSLYNIKAFQEFYKEKYEPLQQKNIELENKLEALEKRLLALESILLK